MTDTTKRYRSKRIYVQAWQFFQGIVMPQWVRDAALVKDRKLFFKRGPVAAVEPNDGDWIVRDDHGNISVFKAEEFLASFEEDSQCEV